MTFWVDVFAGVQLVVFYVIIQWFLRATATVPMEK
jgi:hypothetical protein